MFARVPREWDENFYLALYPDVVAVIANGQFGSGYEHYLKNGRMEGRMFARSLRIGMRLDTCRAIRMWPKPCIKRISAAVITTI